jgi:hypothetical protein
MATFYKFGQLWEIPPAAARLCKSLPANTQAFETFLTNLEPMFSTPEVDDPSSWESGWN